MSLAAALALCVTGGYAFSTSWHPSLYRSVRESGHRTYFRAVFYAAFLFAVSGLLALISCALFRVPLATLPTYVASGSASTVLTEAIADEQVVSILLVGAFVIGAPLGHALNAVPTFVAGGTGIALEVWRTLRTAAWQKAPGALWNVIWSAGGDARLWVVNQAIKPYDFERMIVRSLLSQIPMLATLSNGKAYVGFVLNAPNPVVQRRSIQLLPLLSGYREPDTHRLVFVTNYSDVIEQVTAGSANTMQVADLSVVIPIDQIAYTHLFDLITYEQFPENAGVPHDQVSGESSSPHI